MIHYAKLENSPRLKRLLALLSDGLPHTTMDIIEKARICAVNTAVAELRKNGYIIECRPVRGKQGIYEYRAMINQNVGSIWIDPIPVQLTKNKELF